MTPSKEQIKSWLKTIGKDREWLAKQCGAKSKRTVEKWFETKGIVPAKAILKINELMLQTQYQSSIQPSNLPNQDNRGKMELRLDYDTQRRVEKEALRLRMELSAYCTMAVEWCSQQQGTEKQETAKQGLPSHTESSDPATRKRTTEETLGILRIGTNPGAKRKSGSA